MAETEKEIELAEKLKRAEERLQELTPIERIYREAIEKYARDENFVPKSEYDALKASPEFRLRATEEELDAQERLLESRKRALQAREKGLVDEEIAAREEELQLEIRQEKVRTGNPRLDDLLLGGIPPGSNVTIYGPAYVGKEVLINNFIAEGLRKGVPAIMMLTDKTPDDIREEMSSVLPEYGVHEKSGRVRYVDAYSRSMGSDEILDGVVYVEDPTNHQKMLEAVDAAAKELKEDHEYYRLAFRSVSTLIAYLDPETMFKFLQPFAGRRKRDKAVSMYSLEKGMHGENELNMIGSITDGQVEFKVEQLKTYIAVHGICDAQSRAWIRYTYSTSAMNIGSFMLDHIK